METIRCVWTIPGPFRGHQFVQRPHITGPKWEFPKFGGTLFGVLIYKDPII